MELDCRVDAKGVGFVTLSHYKVKQYGFVVQVTKYEYSCGEGHSNTILEFLLTAALKASVDIPFQRHWYTHEV